jgi:hypothetical protein
MTSRGLWKSVAFALWASVGTASATTTSSFTFDQRLVGRPDSPSTPWITATFVDLSANTVGLSINAPGLVNHQSVGTVYFYVGSGKGSLQATAVSGPSAKNFGVGNAPFGSKKDSYIKLRFDDFTHGDTAMIKITGAGLTAASFGGVTSPNQIAGMAQVLGGSKGGAWVSTGGAATVVSSAPEPEIFATLMAGLAMIGFVARRRRKT